GVDRGAEDAYPLGEPTAAAVLLQPQPQMGGDRKVPVPAHLFSRLPESGVSVLRFDFRGAGGSSGSFGGGAPEAADVRAALHQQHRHTGLPVWLVGWSFGADVSLLVDDPAVAGWVCVTPPLAQPGIAEAAGSDPRSKVLLVAEHDQFCAPDAATERTEGWTSTDTRVLPGADHFLAGQLDRVAAQVEQAVAVNDEQ
ncbi:MAG: alpha/beta hydrolase, partial [Microthrixaceae bacterium]